MGPFVIEGGGPLYIVGGYATTWLGNGDGTGRIIDPGVWPGCAGPWCTGTHIGCGCIYGEAWLLATILFGTGLPCVYTTCPGAGEWLVKGEEYAGP